MTIQSKRDGLLLLARITYLFPYQMLQVTRMTFSRGATTFPPLNQNSRVCQAANFKGYKGTTLLQAEQIWRKKLRVKGTFNYAGVLCPQDSFSKLVQEHHTGLSETPRMRKIGISYCCVPQW